MPVVWGKKADARPVVTRRPCICRHDYQDHEGRSRSKPIRCTRCACDDFIDLA